MKKYGEILGGAVVFLVAAAYFAMAFGIKQFNAGQPGIITSDFMPKIYGAAVMLLGAIQILRGVAELKSAQNAEAQDTDRPPIGPGILLTFALLVAYVALLQAVGFVIMSILFAVGLSCILLPKVPLRPLNHYGFQNQGLWLFPQGVYRSDPQC